MPSRRATLSSSVSSHINSPVDLLDDVVSAGDDVVAVPVPILDRLGELLRVAELLDELRLVVRADADFLAALGEDAAVVLAVADAGVLVVVVHVGLVAGDSPLAPLRRVLPTAELDAGVGEAGVGHAELERKLEIGRPAAAPNEERVPLGGVLLGRLAGDRAVLDAPEPRIAVPTLKALAVEDRPEAGVVRRGAAGDQGHGQQHENVRKRRMVLLLQRQGQVGRTRFRRKQRKLTCTGTYASII